MMEGDDAADRKLANFVVLVRETNILDSTYCDCPRGQYRTLVLDPSRKGESHSLKPARGW